MLYCSCSELDPVVDCQEPSENLDYTVWDTDILQRNDQTFHNCNMDNCDLGVLEHGHQEHLSIVDSGKLWQDGHLIVARLGTTAGNKEDGSDSPDDKLSSISFDCHQKTQMARSFSS